jgi:hypothetical protein
MVMISIAEEVVGEIAKWRVSRRNHPGAWLVIAEEIIELVVPSLADHCSLIIIDYFSIVLE